MSGGASFGDSYDHLAHYSRNDALFWSYLRSDAVIKHCKSAYKPQKSLFDCRAFYVPPRIVGSQS